MASIIKAVFKVDGQESEIIKLNYSLTQNVDNIGQVAGEVKGGVIEVTLGSVGDEKRFGWMVTSDMKKSGDIDFIDSNGATLKTLKFEDAYCVGYTENFEAFDNGKQSGGSVSIKDGGTEKLVLSCKKITVGGENHENTWLDS